MDTYLTIKSFLMILAVLIASSLFFMRVKRLVLLMLAVQGDRSFKLQRIAERIRVFFTDVLGQANVRRKRLVGQAHTLIFFGFLAVQPHSMELIIRGLFPTFHAADAAPGFYGAYLFVADILAFLALIG